MTTNLSVHAPAARTARLLRRLWPAAITVAATIAAAPSLAAAPPLLPEPSVAALAAELDGGRAHRHVEYLALQHRMRGSEPFRAASDYVLAELRRAGYANAEVYRFPADGKTLFGTQKSRLAWDAEFAELWRLEKNGEAWQRVDELADYASTPLSLAQDSDSARLSAELVDVGAGTTATDYAGKDVRGKLVLTSSQPSEARELALERFAPSASSATHRTGRRRGRARTRRWCAGATSGALRRRTPSLS